MKFLTSLTLFTLSLLMISCPGQMVDVLDKASAIDSVYIPQYNTNPNNKSYESIDQKIKDLERNKEKYNNKYSSDTAISNNIKLELLSINANNFPDLIEAKLTVKDSDGKYISGLAPPYIKNKDYLNYWTSLIDSSLDVQNITKYSVEEIRNNNSNPFSIAYLVDYSGSMSYEAKIAINKSIPRMLKSSKKDDYFSFIKFMDNAHTQIPLTLAKDYLNKHLDKNISLDMSDDSLSGGTKIYNGMTTAFKELDKSPPSHQKIIVLITDGEDGFSQAQLDTLKKELIEKDIQVFCISFEAVSFGNLKTVSIGITGFTLDTYYTNQFDGYSNFLDWAAGISGGEHYKIRFEYEIPFVFADIYLRLKNYYLIKYSAPNYKSLHKPSVDLTIDKLNLKAQTSGYYDKSIFKSYDQIGEMKLLNIEFQSGKSVIEQSAFHSLDNIIEYMKNKEKIRLEIIGHTDDIGDQADNLILSKQRANAVKQYFISNGIDAKRLSANGFGESKALVENDSEAHRKQNRRTEFKLLK